MKFKMTIFYSNCFYADKFYLPAKSTFKSKYKKSHKHFPAISMIPIFLLTTVQLMYTGSGDFGSDNWYDEWGEIGGFNSACIFYQYSILFR